MKKSEATKTIEATFERDTKKFHRYVIDEGQLAIGTIYITKGVEAVPEELVIRMKTKTA